MSFIRLRGRLVACVVAVAAAACGGQGRATPVAEISAPTLERTILGEKVHIVPREVLRYKLYLRGFVGGESTIALGEPGTVGGRKVIIARSRTTSTGFARAIKDVRDDVTTHIDVLTGAPVFHRAQVKYGAKEASINTRFSAAGVDIKYRRMGRPERRYKHKLPPGSAAYDAHGVMALVRGWSPREGDRATFYVMSGRRLWRNDVTAVRHERVKTAMGAHTALRIEGMAKRLTGSLRPDPRKKPRKYTMWISLDMHRNVLRVQAETEYGQVRADLVEHTVPAQRYVQH